MSTFTKGYASVVGKAAILTMLLGSTAIAQDATNEAIVPEAAKSSEADKGIVGQSDYPIPEQLDNNEAVIDSLIEQGFSDIHILRKAAVMTVTATRDGQPIELVYNISSGRLVSVDGKELDPVDVDETSDGNSVSSATASDDGTEDGATDDGSTDDGSTDDGSTDDGSTDDGSTDDGSTDDGSSDTDGSDSDGSDTDGSDSDSDGSDTDGSDSDTGGDTGSSDGGSSDGGSSDGGDSGSGSDSGDGSDSGGSDSGGTSGGA